MKLLRKIFDGRIVRLHLERHRLPDGREADFEVVRHSGGAAVLPLLDDGRIVLIRQYRAPLGQMLWEIPAGRLEPDEEPKECVRRELQEETGFIAGRLEKLGALVTAPGFCDETVHLYLARDLKEVGSAPEEDEFIEVHAMAIEQALEMIRRGEISDGKTQLAIFLLQRSISASHL